MTAGKSESWGANNTGDKPARSVSFSQAGVFGRMVLNALTKLEYGCLNVTLPDGSRRVFGHADGQGPCGTVTLKRRRALRRFALGGDLGLAASYIDGDWTSPDLTAVFDVAIANENSPMVWSAGTMFSRAVNRIKHLSRANTRWGSRRNIAYHYDLGNAFYSKWLDPTMTYSSAYYADPAMSLEQAQVAKYDRILELGEIGPGHKVLEVGSGWGGFACHAAGRGSEVHGITVSREQLAHSEERAGRSNAAVAPRFSFLDYRDTQGSYDRIVSIEMLEAVGERNWPDYFAMLRDRLKPGGIAVVQVITIDDGRFAAYRKGADFIQRYIFPGGVLLSPSVMRRLSGAAGLVQDETEFFRLSYARTLAEWNRRFQKAWPDVADLGFDMPFKRMWEYYLSYCEAGFKAGNIDVGLFKIRRPA